MSPIDPAAACNFECSLTSTLYDEHPVLHHRHAYKATALSMPRHQRGSSTALCPVLPTAAGAQTRPSLTTWRSCLTSRCTTMTYLSLHHPAVPAEKPVHSAKVSPGIPRHPMGTVADLQQLQQICCRLKTVCTQNSHHYYCQGVACHCITRLCMCTMIYMTKSCR